MISSDIVIRGAREHNLRGVDVVLPRNQLICLSGVSGSGKSSLAFDTLFAEGQRRYIESLSTFARQFLGNMPKPDVDFMSGLTPSISISQKSSGNNPRSTVGTITEIYDFLRVLYARVGIQYCPTCGRPVSAQTREQILGQILALPSGTKFAILAPLARGQKGEFRDLFDSLRRQGFHRARVDGETQPLSEKIELDRRMRHDIEVVVDRLAVKPSIRARLAEAVDTALKLGEGSLLVALEDDAESEPVAETRPVRAQDAADDGDDEDAETVVTTGRAAKKLKKGKSSDLVFSMAYACIPCGRSFEAPSPQLFSFNSPRGMCRSCDGIGTQYTFAEDLIVPDPSLSIEKGAFAPLGPWKDISRWRRHVLKGVGETLERIHELEAGYLIETSWEELPEAFRKQWLWGTGDTHITFTWRSGKSPMMYGGTFEGVAAELLDKYKSSTSKLHRVALEKFMRTQVCPACEGARLNEQARAVKIETEHSDFVEAPTLSLPELCGLSITAASNYFQQLRLDGAGTKIAGEALKEIRNRLGFLLDVGLDYLRLDRTAPTLSGGEAQRIRLASQIGSGLVGVTYVLDEPSIGLHPRDNDRLLKSLLRLRDLGNTVVVVEHDEDTMRAADTILDFGPGAGVRGGELVAMGDSQELAENERSVTGAYLSGRKSIAVPEQRRSVGERKIVIRGAKHNNLRDVTAEIPLGALVCITGVSGSGKSSLINDVLMEALHRDLNLGEGKPGEYDSIEGVDLLDKLIAIDQSPIGRTPRSNPATYVKLWDEIRNLFAQMPDAKRRGYAPGRFSFNVAGGRCEACEGNGATKLEMDFLADIWVTCPVCQGKRFHRESLQIRFKGKNIADVLEMDVSQALELFENQPKIRDKLQTLHDVGLDYLHLGQPSPTLSGGEAQRIKLARELSKRSTGKTMYVLDEPTTGLHFEDIAHLLRVLHAFVDQGNTVVVIEHNLDVIKTADWIVDLGPEGGGGGGEIVFAGTPEDCAKCARSYTGRALKKVFSAKPGDLAKPRKLKTKTKPMESVRVLGASQHNLRGVDATIKRDAMTVFCGPSGSGKTSLAMDTIYAEGQRRYVESLSSYARQFVSQVQKPRFDSIEGLSPAVAIEQKNLGATPRSTVGTVTEIYDYFRVLFARIGKAYCPACDIPVGTQTTDQIVDALLDLEEGTRAYLAAPLDVPAGQKYENLWDDLRGQGYVRVRIDGQTVSLDDAPKIDRRRKHDVQAIVDRIQIKKDQRSRLADSVENALSLGKGVMHVVFPQEGVDEPKWETQIHSRHMACTSCGRSFEALAPHHFSFNSPLGWCPSCEGLGTQVGANPLALLNSPRLTLAEGALALWPNLELPVGRKMLDIFAEENKIPLDVPFDELPARQRRAIYYGTGDTRYAVTADKSDRVLFRFQFKGFFPSLEEASRLSPTFRSKLAHYVDEVECQTCSGSRLRDDASAVRYHDRTIDDYGRLPLGKLIDVVKTWELDAREAKIGGEALREVDARLRFLVDVGLEYLTLGRNANSLSNGEAQRIRLASQLGSGLCGVLYVLDEPTVGLHPRDNRRLLDALRKLRDLGNTLLVVEHEREVIEASDEIMDFGPGAGVNGGTIVAQGPLPKILTSRKSVTGPYMSGKEDIPIPTNLRPVTDETPRLTVTGAVHHNLKNVEVSFPLGTLTAVTGPSGCGKSSLVNDILFNALAKRLHRATATPGAHREILGLEHINKVIQVDQQALGNSPSSNPATYTGLFELIRDFYAQLPASKLRGYSARRFSFNAAGGRCEKCEGNGQLKIEMHFLPDVWIECDECAGKRYNPETLEVKYDGLSISDVLNLTCGEALSRFANIPKIRKILQTLCDVGLEYVTLGQPAPTLSGGEAQRVKLARELSRPDTGRTLYLLDEPTVGLHFSDLKKLLEVLQRLVDLGNTVVVIEHNLDLIKSVDWVIEMGPEAGADGGRLVAEGPPEQIVAHALNERKNAAKKGSATETLLRSHTGEALKRPLDESPRKFREPLDATQQFREMIAAAEGGDIASDVPMPWEADGRKWHTQDIIDRTGKPVEWDKEIVSRIVDRLEELGGLGETNWNHRSVVEIAAPKKTDGWFFHAITGETWVVKLKFRTKKGLFREETLREKLPLKSYNDLPDLPVYGNEPRIHVKTMKGPFVEIQIDVNGLAEIDLPEFWEFLAKAREGFAGIVGEEGFSREALMPWRQLGRRWHESRKGFPIGKDPKWDLTLLRSVVAAVEEAAPAAEWVWTNQSAAPVSLPGRTSAWATVYTKKPDGVYLTLEGIDGYTQGSVSEFGFDRQVESDPRGARITIAFSERRQAEDAAFRKFLAEHASKAGGK